jgi:type II secretory pathway component GspD/PulD (secretin)
VNTSLRAEFTDADGVVTTLGTVPVSAGAATVEVAVPASAAAGQQTIISYKATNHLIITDRAANIHRLLKIIEQLDVPMVEETITLFPLEFASAKSLADKLTLLMAAEQRVPAAAKPPGPAAFQRVVRVIPDERTNILIVLANAQDTQRSGS